MKIRRFQVNKLIRDKTTDLMRSHGMSFTERPMDTPEYLERLKDKLHEETLEAIHAKTIEETLEELADLSEVMHALSTTLGLSMDQIETKRLAKKESRGGFEKRFFVDYVEGTSASYGTQYFLNNPSEYPEVTEEEPKTSPFPSSRGGRRLT